MISFAELEQAAEDLGFELVYTVGGTAAPEACRWLASGRSVAVVIPADPSVGRASRVTSTYSVVIGGPTRPEASYTGVGPQVAPNGSSFLENYVLQQRAARRS